MEKLPKYKSNKGRGVKKKDCIVNRPTAAYTGWGDGVAKISSPHTALNHEKKSQLSLYTAQE